MSTAAVNLRITPQKSSSRKRYILMDLAAELAAKDRKRQVSFSQMMEGLTGQEFGLSQIEAAQKIRSLVDNGLLVPVEDSGLITFRLLRDKKTSEFEKEREKLQRDWLTAKHNMMEEEEEKEVVTS